MLLQGVGFTLLKEKNNKLEKTKFLFQDGIKGYFFEILKEHHHTKTFFRKIC